MFCSYICKMSLSLRSGHLMCTYNISLWCQNTRNYIHFWLSSPWTVVTDVINDFLATFPNTVHMMLNIEQQIEKIVVCICGNHYYHTPLQLVESSHNISIIYCFTIFTTSPLKIDEPLSTFQFCHPWLGTFGNWSEFIIVGSLSMCFKWYSASRRKTKALQGGKLCH